MESIWKRIRSSKIVRFQASRAQGNPRIDSVERQNHPPFRSVFEEKARGERRSSREKLGSRGRNLKIKSFMQYERLR